MDEQSLLIGRLVTAKEVNMTSQEIEKLPNLVRYSALTKTSSGYCCNRCGAIKPQDFYRNYCQCGQECVYCTRCLAFGKLRLCDKLYHLPAQNWEVNQAISCQWEGELSIAQQQVADDLLAAVKHQRNHLVWAVTGAGKTEMMYPAITAVLRRGGRVGIATPRVDVANELYLRLKVVFAQVDCLLLHGQSDDSYRLTPLMICSTHQLVRFKEAFDLLVIDEIDAFPFYNNAMLGQAKDRAVKKIGSLLLLTATPDKKLQKDYQNQLSILPARYHRHALPVPKHYWVGDWQRAICKGRLPRQLITLIQRYAKEQRRCLIFLPNIQLMKQCEMICHQYFPDLRLASVSSQDEERQSKVQAMRDEKYDFLLTTLILERGVTFPAIHVIVLGSEDATFTTSALVQISGRAGRKPECPTGEVSFLHEGMTRASKQAVKQIQQMNRLGRERGLIDD